ncbi:MAG: lamin tail domain-containing protein, partial [Anaerolineales bacterium]|nr:lamin tail domain-containing protein [Anaerolineales bacterium]
MATSAGANTNAEGLVINEILASNASQQLDTDFYNFSDWIELYNGTNSPLDLNGYYLSDDVANPTKWQFKGSVVIEAHDYLLVWADGEDTGLHTNFGLKHEGETLFLYDTEQNLVDALEFTEQVPDVSYGRATDGAATYVYYSSPTPAQTNNNSLGLAAPITAFEPQFSQNGGFYNGSQQISLTLPPDTPATIYYSLDGSIPDESAEIYSGPITVNQT